MLFNSLQFIIFFTVIVSVYFSIPHKFRWMLLLGASYYFYMCWKAEYLISIIVSTLIDYYAGIQMGKSKVKAIRTKYLMLSLLVNLGLLFSFKYFNFFNDSLRAMFEHFNIFYNIPAFKLLLPIGISFYTFQTLSYSIDVYRGHKEPEKHLGIFALYVAFFPQLVAGPIERSTRLLPQFYEKHNFDYNRICNGLSLMLWGFFKKLVIADRLAIYVNQVYNNPDNYQGLPVLIATYFFAFQIYCDFSGYSDIAIGGAKVLGFDLMINFNRPYFSTSIPEFWKRWHISLSTWFKYYLYIPLGGNRVTKWRHYYNLLVVFLVSGLWHGANWTFIAWGALHGCYILLFIQTRQIRHEICELLYLNKVPKVKKLVSIFLTFHMVVFAWMFFRANSLRDCFTLITNLFKTSFSGIELQAGLNNYELTIAVISIVLLGLFHVSQGPRSTARFLSSMPVYARWLICYFLLFSILIFGQYNMTEFIYFQF